jgi:hypothetical protein
MGCSSGPGREELTASSELGMSVFVTLAPNFAVIPSENRKLSIAGQAPLDAPEPDPAEREGQ